MVSDGGGMDEKERKQYEQLVLTPIHRLIPTLAIPTMASMMTTMLYNLALRRRASSWRCRRSSRPSAS